MDIQAFKIIIIVSSFVLLLILGISITLFTLFQKKKVAMKLEQIRKDRIYEEMLNRSSIEIRENTLKNIAWELHDNVGQLLSLARLELNILKSKSGEHQDKIIEVSNIVGTSLQEIRALSKTLNPEFISGIGLTEAIKLEIDRFNRLNFIKSEIVIHGEPYKISNKDEVILFRIIQEFISNTIKHAQATHLSVSLDYKPEELQITVKDNGKGFDVDEAENGTGLINMKSRAEMINTSFKIDSGKGGTKILLKYKNIAKT